jgi:hypothetical protein
VNRRWVIAGIVIGAALLVGGSLLMDHGRLGARPAGFVPAVGVGMAVAPGGTADPQTKPVALEHVAHPPARTLAFIDATKVSADSAYRVVFVPYGAGSGPKSLVIEITASQPTGAVDHPFDFTGRNAVVSTTRLPASEAVTKGGTYSGAIVLVRQASPLAAGGVLAPMLIHAAPAK